MFRSKTALSLATVPGTCLRPGDEERFRVGILAGGYSKGELEESGAFQVSMPILRRCYCILRTWASRANSGTLFGCFVDLKQCQSTVRRSIETKTSSASNQEARHDARYLCLHRL